MTFVKSLQLQAEKGTDLGFLFLHILKVKIAKVAYKTGLYRKYPLSNLTYEMAKINLIDKVKVNCHWKGHS